MMMKIILTLLMLGTLIARGQTPEEIEKDYETKASKATEKLQATLQREGTAIAANLVSKGDTAGAATVSEQLSAKLDGTKIPSAHPAITHLLGQYDAARANALKPIQDSTLQRLDALLKSPTGKDMQAVLKIAKIREKVTLGSVSSAAAEASPQAKSSKVEEFFVEKSWYSAVGTEYHFTKDQKGFRKHGATKTPLKWKVRADDIVEAEGQMFPDSPPVLFYFRFTNDKEATFGRGSVNALGDPLTAEKP